MRHARAWLAVGGMALMAVAAACSMAEPSAFGDRSSACGGGACKAGDFGEDAGRNGANAPAAAQGAPTSDGVLILHAASFPAFRLCFSEYMDLPPQPDAKVMPQANVVGVEIGSIVRLDPILNPGKVYVIRERQTRNDPPTKKCSEYIAHNAQGGDSGELFFGTDYVEATTTDGKPLGAIGTHQAEVLAISGCPSKSMLARLDGVATTAVDGSACGTPWDTDNGNMKVSIVPLQASAEKPTDSSIPIQLYNMAPAVDALKGKLDVAFGETGKEETLTLPGTFQAGFASTLTVDQQKEDSYGKAAFTVKATLPGSPTPITATQTLADVQHLSAPNDNPTSYYYSASNYALLVLGNPAHKPTLANGDPNPGYNALRTLHILAVPILDPAKADAGADAAASEDAGTK